MYFRFVLKNTLYMLEATVYLGASLFFGLLVAFVYRHYNKNKIQALRPVPVPLQVDRRAILDQKRLAVADRRARLNNPQIPEANQQPDSKPTNTKPETRNDEAMNDAAEDGFGEDLGSALTLNQKLDAPKQDRSAGRSRFGALKDAADELRDVYNKNNTI
jgi:hypothetical protein